MQSKPRSKFLFESACATDATLYTYTNLLNQFLKWAHKDHESLLLLPDDQLNILLEDYVIYMKKRHPRSTIKGHLAAINKFLIINDRQVNSKKLAMFLPAESKPGGEKAITTEQIQRMLSYVGTKRAKAIIHLFTATGSRPEALCDLKMKHVGQMPDGCKSLILYADSTHELTTFLTPESSNALDEYFEARRKRGEYLRGESYVIGRETFIVNEKKPRPVSVNSLESSLTYAMKRAGIKRIKIGNRYDLAVCGGFRKRFDTIMKINPNISYAIAEKMMDHKIRMEGYYFKPTKEEMFEEYKKAIPELTIDESIRLEEKIKHRDEQIHNLETDKDRRITNLEVMISELSKRLDTKTN